LRPDALSAWLAKAPQSMRASGDALLAKLGVDPAARAKRLEELLAELPAGDVRRGQLVFNGEKAACSTCHQLGYVGGDVGPDLTRIGTIRSKRDLLEALVFPSASFVRSYEPVAVVTKRGVVLAGILRDESSDGVLLVSGADERARVARDDILEMLPDKTSVMPAGLTELITRQELADLLAFLVSRRG